MCQLYPLLCLVTQLCPTLQPVDCSRPGSSVHRQEYCSGLPCPPARDLPNPGIEPRSSRIAGRFFTIWATREALTPQPALNRRMIGIGLCQPSSSGNTNPLGCTLRTAGTRTLEHWQEGLSSLHPSKLHPRCPQSVFSTLLTYAPEVLPTTTSLHKTAHKFWREESWRRGPEDPTPSSQARSSPNCSRDRLGRVCRVVAPPRARCWHCKPSPENWEAEAKPATLRAKDTAGLSLPPSHFPHFHPGHLYLNGWDYGRDRMTSLSLPAAEREKSRASVVCPFMGVGEQPWNNSRKEEGRGGVAGEGFW